jgi:F-type H+-transporting ATPase subunit gamma
MPSIRTIRRRIRSVQNIAKITKAMEMIAASKMRKSQERGLAGRAYAAKIREVIASLSALPGVERLHPLLDQREVRNITIVHITPDRGLCGGLNGSLNRNAAAFVLRQEAPVNFICVGRKGLEFMTRTGRDIRAEFINLGDKPNLQDVLPIASIVTGDYTARAVDKVCLSYARFISTTVQKPEIVQLLPVEPAEIPAGQNVDYLYEPGPREVLDSLLPRFVEMQIYHTILEAIASEQSARMVAMKNATDNANELVGDLTLAYNKARQEVITKELLDITGGVAALT